MSNIHDAIVNAAQSTLSQYLAPELADKLTEEIAAKARGEIEAVLTACVGFDFGKAAAPRGKAGLAPARPGRRRREPTPQAPEDEAAAQNVQ